MKELFEYLALKEVTPNALYILWCAATKTKSSLKTSVIHTELRVLVNDDLLDASYGVTTKGMAILNNIPGITGSMTVAQEDAEDSIIKFLNIFPKGKLPSGKPARVNVKNLEGAFKWYFETYDYSWEIILKATEKYVSEYELKRYEYMRNSQYFIRKQNLDKSFESDLATYCELVVSGADEVPTYFRDNIV